MADHVKVKIRSRLDEACNGSEGVLSCSVTDLEAICQDVLEAEMTRTNRILGRKRRRRRRKRSECRMCQ